MHRWEVENGDIIWERARALQLYIRVQRAAVEYDESIRSAGSDRVQGLQSTRGSSLDVPHSPCIPLPQLSDPGPESSTVILLTDLNRRSHAKLQYDKHTVTSVVICIELLVIIRPALTRRRRHPNACFTLIQKDWHSNKSHSFFPPTQNPLFISWNWIIAIKLFERMILQNTAVVFSKSQQQTRSGDLISRGWIFSFKANKNMAYTHMTNAYYP